LVQKGNKRANEFGPRRVFVGFFVDRLERTKSSFSLNSLMESKDFFCWTFREDRKEFFVGHLERKGFYPTFIDRLERIRRSFFVDHLEKIEKSFFY
jgi:hypothetical protein